MAAKNGGKTQFILEDFWPRVGLGSSSSSGILDRGLDIPCDPAGWWWIGWVVTRFPCSSSSSWLDSVSLAYKVRYLTEQNIKFNFKLPSMQRWQCPITTVFLKPYCDKTWKITLVFLLKIVNFCELLHCKSLTQSNRKWK